jgi:hypothetical protein
MALVLVPVDDAGELIVEAVSVGPVGVAVEVLQAQHANSASAVVR